MTERQTVDFGSHRILLRTRRTSSIVNTRTATLVIVALLGGMVTFFLAVSLGKFPVPLGEVFSILGGGDHGFSNQVVLEWRLPRAVAGLVFGAGLGVSGAIFQSITRNPLGSPDVIGLGVGAYTGALIASLVFGGGVAVTVLALAGGVGSALIVYLLSYRRGLSGIRFVVVGIALSSALTAVNSILLLRMSTRFATTVSIWGQGSLVDVTWAEVWPAALCVLVLILLAAGLGPSIRQLELGDSAAASTGVPIERARLALLAVGVLLTAIITSITGPIAFIALIAPQLARLLTGNGRGHPRRIRRQRRTPAQRCRRRRRPTYCPSPFPSGSSPPFSAGTYLLALILREARLHDPIQNATVGYGGPPVAPIITLEDPRRTQ